MTISDKGLDIIKEHEGLELSSYLDPVGIWTIGYGHTDDGRGVDPSMTITKEKADELLRWDVRTAEEAVLRQVTSDINQNQFDALVSWTFNLGSGRLASSTLRKKVNENPNDQSIRDEFMRWVHGAGSVLPGLVKRRTKEADHYFTDKKKEMTLLLASALCVLAVALIFIFKLT